MKSNGMTKIRMTYGFALQAARIESQREGKLLRTAMDLAAFANTSAGKIVFPEGLSLAQAEYLFSHLDDIVDEKQEGAEA